MAFSPAPSLPNPQQRVCCGLQGIPQIKELEHVSDSLRGMMMTPEHVTQAEEGRCHTETSRMEEP